MHAIRRQAGRPRGRLQVPAAPSRVIGQSVGDFRELLIIIARIQLRVLREREDPRRVAQRPLIVRVVVDLRVRRRVNHGG